MARVTNLKREGGKQHCPGAVVKFEATTEPPNSTGIKWKVDGHVVRTLGNTLRVSGAGGDSKVVTASLENSLSSSVAWKIAGLKVDVRPKPDHGRYVITDEPRMPVITVLGVGGSARVSQWEGSVIFSASSCPPFGPLDRKTTFRFSQRGGNALDFGRVVRGGFIGGSVTGKVKDCQVSAGYEAGLVGTNPRQTHIQNLIKAELKEAGLPQSLAHTLGRIACKESGPDSSMLGAMVGEVLAHCSVLAEKSGLCKLPSQPMIKFGIGGRM